MRSRLKSLLHRFSRELDLYRLVLRDPRTPRLAKILLAAAVAYALSPVDIIPDFIPGIGHLDDLLIVPLLVWLAVRLIPKAVLDDCRKRTSLATPAAGPGAAENE